MAYVSQFMQLISYISDSYILFSAVLNFSPHGEVEGAYSSTSPQGLVGVGCRASGGGVRLGVGVARSSLLPPHPEVTHRVRVQRGAQILRGQVESVLDLLTPSTSKIITIIIMAFGLGAWVLPTHNSIFRVLNCGHLPTY